MTTGLEPSAATLEPLPFSVLLDRALAETRRHLRLLWPPFAITSATLGLLVLLFSRLVPAYSMKPQPGSAAGMLPLLALDGTIFVVSLGYYLLGQATTVAAVRAADGGEVSGTGALSWVLRPASLKTLALLLACYAGSFCCCFFVILYIGPLLAFAIPAQASEGVSGSAALQRSALLARYNPARRLGSSPILGALAISVMGIVASLLMQLAISLPFMLFQGADVLRRLSSGELLTNLQGLSAGPLWLEVPKVCLGAAASSAVTLYCSFALALLFFDVRRRREGADLQAAVAGMTVGTPPQARMPGDPGSPPV